MGWPHFLSHKAMTTIARSIVTTDEARLNQLAETIAELALHQCKVYCQSVPTSMIPGILVGEVKPIDKQRTLEIAVLNAIERRVNTIT